jgi:flagellin-like protein
MKGVSAVIATILMLMITIALAGTAYLYITGIFGAKTGVVLSIDGTASTCTAQNITIFVKNDGTTVGTVSTLTLTKPDSTQLTCSLVETLPFNINAGSFNHVTCVRPTGASSTPAGLYGVTVSTGVTSASGSMYCASAS